jgi:hypothetical protein
MDIAEFRLQHRQTAVYRLRRSGRSPATIRERVRDAKRHRDSQLLFNGGKRPFGFDVEDKDKDKDKHKHKHLVPTAAEQAAALARGKVLQSEGARFARSPRSGPMSSASRSLMPTACGASSIGPDR